MNKLVKTVKFKKKANGFFSGELVSIRKRKVLETYKHLFIENI